MRFLPPPPPPALAHPSSPSRYIIYTEIEKCEQKKTSQTDMFVFSSSSSWFPAHLASRQRRDARIARSSPNSSFPRSFREVGDRQAGLAQLFEGEIKLSDHFRRHLRHKRDRGKRDQTPVVIRRARGGRPASHSQARKSGFGMYSPYPSM